VFIFETYTIITIPIIFTTVFGKVENFWHSIEAQNMGALHFDGMLWLEGEVPVDAVVTEKPRGEDCKILQDLIVK
jgi:hypothetical protein